MIVIALMIILILVDGGEPSAANKYIYGNGTSVMYWESEELNIQSSSFTIELWLLRTRRNIRECIVTIWRNHTLACSLCTNGSNNTMVFMMESESIESSNEHPLNEW